jgi:hypothetical protein
MVGEQAVLTQEWYGGIHRALVEDREAAVLAMPGDGSMMRMERRPEGGPTYESPAPLLLFHPRSVFLTHLVHLVPRLASPSHLTVSGQRVSRTAHDPANEEGCLADYFAGPDLVPPAALEP